MTPPGNVPPAPNLEWKEVLEFVRVQGEKDRTYFDQLFKRTMWSIGLILGVVLSAAAFFGVRSLSDMRSEMRRQTTTEIETMRSEVRRQIEAQFQSDKITELVRSVARERAQTEIDKIIAAEVSRQVQLAIQREQTVIQQVVSAETQRAVKNLNPMIEALVGKQTGATIDTALRPFQQTLADYREIIHTGTLATSAMSGSREAYFQLQTALKESKSPDARQIAGWTLIAINDEDFEMLKTGTLNPNLGAEFLLQASHNPSPTLRAKVIEEMARSKDRRYVPRIMEVIKTDQDIRVLRAALRSIILFSGGSFRSYQEGIDSSEQWWEKHQGEYK